MSGSTRSYDMARRFVAAGHEVHVITSARDRNTELKGWKEETLDGIHVHWLSVPYSNTMSFSRRIIAFFKFAVASSLKARNIGGDVVFATSTPLTIAIPGVLASKKFNIPLVFEVRDLWPKVPIAIGAVKNPIAIFLARWLERFAYDHSTRIVAFSPHMKNEITKVGVANGVVTVVPNGCDNQLFRVPAKWGLEFRREHQYLEEGQLCIHAGSISQIDGVDYLVAIAHEMLKLGSNVKFLIVGRGRSELTIRRLAEKLGVYEKNLWIMPPVAKKTMPKLMSAATISVAFAKPLAVLEDSFPNKSYDSLAAGKPLMINHRGWQADILEETGAGIVVPPDDARKAAEMLHDFLQDQERLEKAGRAAAELADTRFSRDKLAGQLLTVLDAAVAEAKR